jgi:PIN domain nuclease of toxin-antitoxin system
MRALLDTHTFIWLDNDPGKLSETVAALCSDKENVLFLSIASVWEMQIKLKLGKLTLPLALDKTIAEQRQANGLHLLPIELRHVLALDVLPDHHKDPFDRLLIAQAKAEGLTLITNDPVITKYPVTVAW